MALKRNCSIAPHQLALVYSALCVTSLLVASCFTVRGAWYVLAFSGLELSAVGFAFFLFARHATDRECIELHGNCLLIEMVEAERVSRFRLDPRLTRVKLSMARTALVTLETGGIKVEVGRFLKDRKRREFAQELRSALAFEG